MESPRGVLGASEATAGVIHHSSSTSGIVGNEGQANYAASNTSLDAFASYRQMLGLHANTVDLGLIEDVCCVAEQNSGLEVRFNKRQWTPINEGMLRES